MALKITAPKRPGAPVLPAGLASDYSLIQAEYPKIGEKITLMWGSVVLQEYLSKTIFDERGGRQGFPLTVVSALMRLHEYHGSQLPEIKKDESWGHVK
jgi:hypothetical protein